MLSKLMKFAAFSCFFGILTWFGAHIINILFIFPDWRINTLAISCVLFIVVIAVKRGVWH